MEELLEEVDELCRGGGTSRYLVIITQLFIIML